MPKRITKQVIRVQKSTPSKSGQGALRPSVFFTFQGQDLPGRRKKNISISTSSAAAKSRKTEKEGG
jgi:hypothetical protein